MGMEWPYFPVAELANPVNRPGKIKALGADQAQQLRCGRAGFGWFLQQSTGIGSVSNTPIIWWFADEPCV
jgi:hypothetical protein